MPSLPLCPECHLRGRAVGNVLGPDGSRVAAYVCITPNCPVDQYRPGHVDTRSPEPDTDQPPSRERRCRFTVAAWFVLGGGWSPEHRCLHTAEANGYCYQHQPREQADASEGQHERRA